MVKSPGSGRVSHVITYSLLVSLTKGLVIVIIVNISYFISLTLSVAQVGNTLLISKMGNMRAVCSASTIRRMRWPIGHFCWLIICSCANLLLVKLLP